jgi:hypothetical protein
MDLFVSPRAAEPKSFISPKISSSLPPKSHNLTYKHVGNDIYPVMLPKKQSLNYYADNVKVYYKRKVKHFDQSASTHILPGGEFIKGSRVSTAA